MVWACGKKDEDWVKKCLNLSVDGKVGRGRSRKTWSECVKRDMKILGLKVEDTKDRLSWRRKIFGTRLSRASMEKTDAKR